MSQVAAEIRSRRLAAAVAAKTHFSNFFFNKLFSMKELNCSEGDRPRDLFSKDSGEDGLRSI